MSEQRKALEAALEVLEQLQGGCTDSGDGTVEALTVWCPEIIEQIQAALAEPEPNQWQTIETAPFGVDVLVFNNGYIKQDYRSLKCTALWTHWMPLPQPPKE
jgi:hypothetical protein